MNFYFNNPHYCYDSGAERKCSLPSQCTKQAIFELRSAQRLRALTNLQELACQTSPVVKRISLQIRTFQPDQCCEVLRSISSRKFSFCFIKWVKVSLDLFTYVFSCFDLLFLLVLEFLLSSRIC